MCRSLCSQVATLPPNQLGVRCGSKGHPQAATPMGDHWEIAARKTNRHGDPVDLLEP
jgi:hypothetical protein